ncbi:MAG: GTP 3',8-cyclase MoaA, partial [Bacillota bacterium]
MTIGGTKETKHTRPMVDGWGRTIDYLRVSITDRCNMRCVYCMPPQGVPAKGCKDILRYEEIEQVIKVARELGISHIRITGGEPLVRKGVVTLVREIKNIGIDDISMTTNAMLLPKYAVALKESGLSRVNISLDSLRPERFSSITRNGDLEAVMAGIKSAIDEGLHPVKINVVVMAGTNADELGDMAALTKRMPVHVRFIEVMPVGPDGHDNNACFVPVSVMKREIQKEGPLKAVESPKGAGPAEAFTLPDALGTV